MSEVKLNDIPESLEVLIKFWSDEDVINRSPQDAVRSDILDYLSWVSLQKVEIANLRAVLEDAKDDLIYALMDRPNELWTITETEAWEKTFEDSIKRIDRVLGEEQSNE